MTKEQERALRAQAKAHGEFQDAMRNLSAANIAGAHCDEIAKLAALTSAQARRWAQATEEAQRVCGL